MAKKKIEIDCRRRAERFPCTNLCAHVVRANEVTPVVARDIGLIGIGIETGPLADVKVADKLTLHLNHDKEVAAVDGMVVRHEDGVIGIEFPKCLQLGHAGHL